MPINQRKNIGLIAAVFTFIISLWATDAFAQENYKKIVAVSRFENSTNQEGDAHTADNNPLGNGK